MNNEQYDTLVAALKDLMWPRIEKILDGLREIARQRGFQVGSIDDMTDEQFHWSFVIHPVKVDDVGRWHETDLGVDFEIEESKVHEGDTTGVNFSLKFQGDGGRTYRIISPYNYTDQCWVPLDQTVALDDRMKIVETEAAEALELALADHLTPTQ